MLEQLCILSFKISEIIGSSIIILTQNINQNRCFLTNKMQSLTGYQKQVFSFIQSIKFNVLTDYEGEVTKQNAHNIVTLYINCYKQRNTSKRYELYSKLKSNIHDKNQLLILQWLEKQRGQKYLSQDVPSTQIKKEYQTIKICSNPDNLEQTRVIGLLKNIPVLEKVSLDSVHISQSVFMIQTQSRYQKMCLFRKVKQRQQRPTPWIVEKTKDHRYIWRASCGVDRSDVCNLLLFILLKRSEEEDRCPSIFINTGSHGDILGNTASDISDFRLTAQFIYEETLDTLSSIIEKYQSQLRVNRFNIRTKVCINFMSSSFPSIYPDLADHVIDTQCFGAYKSIKAQRLHPPGTFVVQEDLKFLQGKLQAQIQKFKQTQIQAIRTQSEDKKAEIEIKNLVMTMPMKKLLQDSAIIKTQRDAFVLVNLFYFVYGKEKPDNKKIYKKLKDLDLVYRASQNYFSISSYFETCGNLNNTFFLCLTEKNKIVGAFCPYSHSYKFQTFNDFTTEEGQWVQDPQKDSFVFSVTNSQAFTLQMTQNAIFRKRDKSQVVFGLYDFSISDRANVMRESKALNNLAYSNEKYDVPDQNETCIQNCIKFNGNEDPHFLIKQWQVWQIQLEQYTPKSLTKA